jgi:hypothetical protein
MRFHNTVYNQSTFAINGLFAFYRCSWPYLWFGSPSTHSAASYSTISALRWLQVRIVPEHFIPGLNRVKYMFSSGHEIKILEIKINFILQLNIVIQIYFPEDIERNQICKYSIIHRPIIKYRILNRCLFDCSYLLCNLFKYIFQINRLPVNVFLGGLVRKTFAVVIDAGGSTFSD